MDLDIYIYIVDSAHFVQYVSIKSQAPGFAVTLIAGISASLFTSIFVVRTFYLIWLNRARSIQTLSI